MQLLKFITCNEIDFFFIKLIVKFYANIVLNYLHKTSIIKIKHLKQIKKP